MTNAQKPPDIAWQVGVSQAQHTDWTNPDKASVGVAGIDLNSILLVFQPFLSLSGARKRTSPQVYQGLNKQIRPGGLRHGFPLRHVPDFHR